MIEFLKFFDDLKDSFPLHLEITYNKHTDWGILVYKKDCAEDYPDSPSLGRDALLVDIQGCDMELVFAQAQVELKKWLTEYRGGY